jgi:hypothetical protein
MSLGGRSELGPFGGRCPPLCLKLLLPCTIACSPESCPKAASTRPAAHSKSAKRERISGRIRFCSLLISASVAERRSISILSSCLRCLGACRAGVEAGSPDASETKPGKVEDCMQRPPRGPLRPYIPGGPKHTRADTNRPKFPGVPGGQRGLSRITACQTASLHPRK